MEKVIILGSGIAGLTAAIYTARANLSPLVLSGHEDGGQLTLTTDVENFPCFPDGIQGPEMVQRAKQQAEKFGARFQYGFVTGFEHTGSHSVLHLEDGSTLETQTLIIATGASARWLGLDSEKEYQGKGVTTCATCDGAFYKDQKVVVVGGGDTAMEEALFLTRFASEVTLIHRRDAFRASKIMQERTLKHEKIKVLWNKTVEQIVGDSKKVTGVQLKDTQSGDLMEHACDGVFLAIGHIPNTQPFKGKLELDTHGYLITDRFMKTKLKGVYGAGDVQDTHYRQAITAAGSGCQAAIEAERYLAELE